MLRFDPLIVRVNVRLFPSQIPFDFELIDSSIVEKRSFDEGIYYYCSTYQDGTLESFGWVVGKQSQRIISIYSDKRDTVYFDWHGQWGYLSNGIAQYYVHGHEEGDGTEKPMELSEVLERCFAYARDSFDSKCRRYFDEQNRLSAIEELDRKKEIRYRLIAYGFGLFFLGSLIYVFFLAE